MEFVISISRPGKSWKSNLLGKKIFQKLKNNRPVKNRL